MLVSLPLAAYCLLVRGFVKHGSDGRSAVLHGATALGVLAVLITEALSLPGWLTPGGLAAAWVLVVAVCLVILAHAAGEGRGGGVPGPRAVIARLGAVDLALVGGAGVVIALIGAVALLSPPNTWDAMQYHLPRVVHWIQNRGVAFYPTHELKQLHMAPGAEYLMLQLHALWGGDRLDNLIQWFAMLGSVAGVTVLARSLGAGSRGQVLAAVACATIPEGILTASGAKNDYVLSLWLVALAFYALRFGREPDRLNGVGLGATLGLAWLTKGTAYAFAAPMLVTLAVFWPWTVKRAFLRQVPLVLLLAIGLNAGHFVRNHGLHGSPLGPSAEGPSGLFKYTNDTISVSTTLSNILRNTAVHVRGAHRAWNEALEGWLGRVIRGAGADPDDPGTNFFNFTPFRLPEVERHEGFAGNPVHLLLAAVTLPMLCFSGFRPDRRAVAVFSLGLVVSFVVFCALLKWQPLSARLHLPLFVLGSAAIGAVIGSSWPAVAVRGLAALLLVLSVPFVVGNELRSLWPGREFSVLTADRTHLYFGDRRDVADSYVAVARFVGGAGCRSVALDLSHEVGAQYEYPLLALLGAENGSSDVRVVGVTNASAVYSRNNGGFEPCAVICVRCAQLRQGSEPSGVDDEEPAVFGDIVAFLSHGEYGAAARAHGPRGRR